MKKSSTTFLKCIVLFIALGTLAGLLWFPQAEGRAANLDLVSIYSDPFIIYIYIAATPFFVGLYQAVQLLTFIETNAAFSQKAVNTLKIMKLASLSLIGFIAAALLFIRVFAQGDDPAGPTALGLLMMLIFAVIATVTGIFQKLFQNAVDIKSEHDLTV